MTKNNKKLTQINSRRPKMTKIHAKIAKCYGPTDQPTNQRMDGLMERVVESRARD